MLPYPYFAKKTDNASDDKGRKKMVVYALCYIAIGFVANLVMFMSIIGVFTSSCPSGACPSVVTLIRALILNPEFWLNVIVWPVKLVAFLWRSF